MPSKMLTLTSYKYQCIRKLDYSRHSCCGNTILDRGRIDYGLGLMRVMYYSNLFLIALTTSIYVVEKNVITDCLDEVMQFQGGHVYIVCFLGVDQGRASLGTWWVEGGGVVERDYRYI